MAAIDCSRATVIWQPDPLGLPRDGHVDDSLSADANSTCSSHHPLTWTPRVAENPFYKQNGREEEWYQAKTIICFSPICLGGVGGGGKSTQRISDS